MEKKQSFIGSLLNFRGNQRVCVYTQALWGIPFALYSPFVSMYMYALGLREIQIGTIASVSLAMQMVTSLLGGVLIDKFGRRVTLFIADIVAWGIPCLIWAFAQSFEWFIFAVIFNGFNLVAGNANRCLMSEDSDPSTFVEMNAWLSTAGLIAVFFAPIAGFCVNHFDLIPTQRILYIISFFMMSAKYIVCYIFSKETSIGLVKINENKNVPIYKMLLNYGKSFKKIFSSRAILLTLGIMIFSQITGTFYGNFFSLYVTNSIGISADWIAYFPIIRAIISLFFYFNIQKFLSRLPIFTPILIGCGVIILGHLFLIYASFSSYFHVFVVLSVLLDALGIALVAPRKDSLIFLVVHKEDRAKISALLSVLTVGISIPFGYISGVLAKLNELLPFVAIIIGYIIIAGLGIVFMNLQRKDKIIL